ncbi:hypothetical protein BCR35DRAFT_301582 [Leucosporidium creatinivorum]|uniref:Uncharacterized protein n=1 Tax=Leucosporidium creatinivorum TaxID=106004 RepID=A0A1Y2FWU3_9BASI|nr:hypothetical protein BCR35DRAFT_301582 [Leucosporidium creatinivorum]
MYSASTLHAFYNIPLIPRMVAVMIPPTPIALTIMKTFRLIFCLNSSLLASFRAWSLKPIGGMARLVSCFPCHCFSLDAAAPAPAPAPTPTPWPPPRPSRREYARCLGPARAGALEVVVAVPTGLGVREVEGEDEAVRSESVGGEKGFDLLEVTAAAGGRDMVLNQGEELSRCFGTPRIEL